MGINLSGLKYFTVMCLVTWPLHANEAGVDLVIQTLLFSIIDVARMLISWNLHKKSSEVSSSLATLSFIG